MCQKAKEKSPPKKRIRNPNRNNILFGKKDLCMTMYQKSDIDEFHQFKNEFEDNIEVELVGRAGEYEIFDKEN